MHACAEMSDGDVLGRCWLELVKQGYFQKAEDLISEASELVTRLLLWSCQVDALPGAEGERRVVEIWEICSLPGGDLRLQEQY